MQRSLSESRSSRLCNYPAAARVNVDVGPQLIAHVGGIHRCGSPWCCPLCSPVVREGRALEIDLGASVALSEGMGVELVSITVPHHRNHPLAGRLGDCASALQQILKGSAWDRRKSRLGYAGAIRALEMTWGERNGWHPHVHALLFFDRVLTAAERSDLQTWMTTRWSRICERKLYGTLHRRHGIDVRPVLSPDDGVLKGYLTKIDGGWSAGRELARSDVKSSNGGLTPWQLLGQVMETGESRYARLWQEFERATFGRRALVWSPGLRARLLGTDEAPTDDELAASEGADVATLVRFLVAPSVWLRLQHDGTAGDFLTRCEQRAAEVIDQVDIDPTDPYVIDVQEDDQ